jgi:DDE superfamily endonuclease
MVFSCLPDDLTRYFAGMSKWLQRLSAQHLRLVFVGILFARGRRTCTAWFRACGIAELFRQAYNAIWAAGCASNSIAISVWLDVVRPLLRKGARLLVGIDDTPTERYGPHVEGAGIHHNPTPGPANHEHLYGHVWVTLAVLAEHPTRGTIALPLQARLYIRAKDIPQLPPEHPRDFHTKLEIAVEQLHWLKPWLGDKFGELVSVVDGAYAKKPYLKGAKKEGFVVISRLRKDAALFSLPQPNPTSKRGPKPIYGKERIRLSELAAEEEGWQEIECKQYGEVVTKRIKTFLATWRPAGGVIRVVLVKEEKDWLPFFCTKTEPSANEIVEAMEARQVLSAMADRNALEQTFKDVKEVWGAGQQQVRNVDSSEGCFNLNLWMYSVVEAWAWNRPDDELVDRSASPWDNKPRRPSHADKRKALQRQILHEEIEAALRGRPNKQEIRSLLEAFLDMAV